MSEEVCGAVIENARKRELAGGVGSVKTALVGVAGDLKQWSRSSLGDMEKHIAKLKEEIEACRR